MKKFALIVAVVMLSPLLTATSADSQDAIAAVSYTHLRAHETV